jgi:hypothetical protein
MGTRQANYRPLASNGHMKVLILGLIALLAQLPAPNVFAPATDVSFTISVDRTAYTIRDEIPFRYRIVNVGSEGCRSSAPVADGKRPCASVAAAPLRLPDMIQEHVCRFRTKTAISLKSHCRVDLSQGRVNGETRVRPLILLENARVKSR